MKDDSDIWLGLGTVCTWSLLVDILIKFSVFLFWHFYIHANFPFVSEIKTVMHAVIRFNEIRCYAMKICFVQLNLFDRCQVVSLQKAGYSFGRITVSGALILATVVEQKFLCQLTRFCSINIFQYWYIMVTAITDHTASIS